MFLRVTQDGILRYVLWVVYLRAFRKSGTFNTSRSGGIGRRARLKIVFPPGMWVRFPPSALNFIWRSLVCSHYTLSNNILHAFCAGGCSLRNRVPPLACCWRGIAYLKHLYTDAIDGGMVLYFKDISSATFNILLRRKSARVVPRFHYRWAMRLNLILAIMDFLIILAYPFVFLFEKVRQLFKFKR